MPQMTQTCTYCRTPFGIHLTRCPNCGTTANDVPSTPAPSVLSAPKAIPVAPTESVTASPFVQSKDAGDTEVFRPMRRRACAALCILFDGETQLGEWRRVHKDETVIGLGDADVPIAFDPAVAERHAVIVRQTDGDAVRWLLKSLNADAGVFVRNKQSALNDGDELLIGSRYWRFSLPKPDAVGNDGETPDDATQAWRSLSASDLNKLVPSFIEVSKNDDGRVFPLKLEGENRIGRNKAQNNIVLDDPFVNPLHAEIGRDGDKWFLRDLDSRNGTWLRIQEKVLENQTEFQLGEQRFRFVTPNEREVSP